MTYRAQLPKPPKGKSLASRVSSTPIFAAFISLFVYIILGILKCIVTPLTWIWASDEELDGGKSKQKAMDSITARSVRRDAFAEDPRDPMFQYIDRFVERPMEHLGEPNEQYNEWFEQYTRGEILDSDLRWAPEVYDLDHKICNQFLSYLENQVRLHKNHPVASVNLLRTIRKFYPEFEPNYNSILETIDGLRRRNNKRAERSKMSGEIEKAGITEGVALALGALNLGREELRTRIELARKWLAHGYAEEVVRVMVVNGVRDEGVVEQANILHEVNVDPQVAVDMANGKLTLNDVRRIEEFAVNFQDVMGDAAYAPAKEQPERTLMEVAIESEISRVHKAHRRDLRNAAWRK